MTLAEFDDKIEKLTIIKANTSGLEMAQLTSLIDDLSTKRVAFMTAGLRGHEISLTSQDVDELNNIAQTFETGAQEIGEANQLIDRVLSIGNRLVNLLA